MALHDLKELKELTIIYSLHLATTLSTVDFRSRGVNINRIMIESSLTPQDHDTQVPLVIMLYCVISQHAGQTALNVYLSGLAHGMVQDYCDCFSCHLLNSQPDVLCYWQ